MPVPVLPIHILSMLSVIHTARGEAELLAERLPHWRKGLSYPGGWTPTSRQLRRWRLLYSYWQNEQEMLLKRSIRRKHLDEDIARQLRDLGAQLEPPTITVADAALDTRIHACVQAPFPWREQHGLAEPITVDKLWLEARIPAFQLIRGVADPQMLHVGNRSLMTLGVCLGQFLNLPEPFGLALDAGLPEELRLRDEAIGLPLALTVLKELGEVELSGVAADGALDGDGKLLMTQGFDHPYGKLEACFDAGLRLLYVPWGTRLCALPKAGILLEQPVKGDYEYFFSDWPEDRMRIVWLKDLKEATRLLWGERSEAIADRLRARVAPPPENPFDNWDALYHKIEEGYPDWLAVSFKLFFELYRELAANSASSLPDWQDLMRQQARWIHLWLRYLLALQASGMLQAQQPLEEIWPAFPACCDPDASLYLLWQALQQLCQLEQKGPLPFRHVHQWLCRHQTGWGMLLNQLIQLEENTAVDQVREAMRYNMQRLMELLKSAEFMINYPLYGVLQEQGEEALPAGHTLGVQYQSLAKRGALVGELPVGPGGLYLEDPRTRTRFQLGFLHLCPECCALEQFAPLIFAGWGEDGSLRFEGCDHAPLMVADETMPTLTGLASTYGWSTQPWVTAQRRMSEPDTAGGEHAVMACVVHSEMLLDPYTTMQDPQQVIATYERMINELMGYLKLNSEDPHQLIVHFSNQAVSLAFVRHPESALAFALALHQLVSDYNARQTVPSAHLQIRTGLDIGCVWLGPEPGRIGGQPLQRALWLAHRAEAGQLLASDVVRQTLARVSTEHRQLFHLVGATSEDEAVAENVYTLYTRSTGLRRVPARLPCKSRGPLGPSQLDTKVLTKREPSLVWLGVLAVEIPRLGRETPELAQARLQALEKQLIELARPQDWEPSFVPLEHGLIVVFDKPLQAAFMLGVELLAVQPAEQPLQVAVHIGIGELKPRHDSQFNLRGPVRSRIQQLLDLRRPGQLLCDASSRELLNELAPELVDRFQLLAEAAEAGIFSLGPPGEGLARSAERQPLPPADVGPALQQVFDPSSPIPLTAVLVEAKKLARSRLEYLMADRFGEAFKAAGPPRVVQNHLGMLFQHIKPGHFTMGSPASEPGRTEDETQHLVVLTKPFYLLTTPVNQKQWQAITGHNPSFFRHPDLPVESISWEAVNEFIDSLNALGKEQYRLPTEAEWEYCCRAGSKQAFCFGAEVESLGEYAWYQGNSGEGYQVKQPHPVATRRPNAWGLYDMHGNVWEWVSDWYDDLPAKAVTNPIGPEQGKVRVIRGGRWNSSASSCRSASRSFLPPEQGYPGSLSFRLVMEV